MKPYIIDWLKRHFHNTSKMASKSPSKRWIFTYNNYNESTYNQIIDYLKENSQYAIVGKEIASSGTPHLQGYFCLKVKLRLVNIKSKIGLPLHLEQARGTCQQNRMYCTKDGDFWEFGTMPKYSRGDTQRTIDTATSSFIDIMDSGNNTLRDFMVEHPTPWLVHGRALMSNYYLAANEIDRPSFFAIWIWGPTGIGKSHFANEYYPDAYRKCPTIKWWHRYRLQHSVIVDEIDSSTIETTYWLKWLDKYKCTVETKGGDIPLHAQEFIFTSNYPPEAVFFKSINAILRRLKVYNVNTRSDFDEVARYLTVQRDIALIDRELQVIESSVSDSTNTEIIEDLCEQ